MNRRLNDTRGKYLIISQIHLILIYLRFTGNLLLVVVVIIVLGEVLVKITLLKLVDLLGL